MRVFLIHGMGRSRASMLLLASRLKRAGHRPSTFGYLVTRDSLDVIRDKWVQHIAAVRAADGAGDAAPYAVIGHSLGNVITRYATSSLPPGLARFVMLAPPNQAPKLARLLERNPLYRALTGDAGRRLASAEFYAGLQTPDVPTLIFAGDVGRSGRLLPFGSAGSDGVVGVEETRLGGDGKHEHRVVAAVHTLIMNDREVTRTICQFLEKGSLEQA